MKYKYILFDLDGTLSESAEGITKCVQYALHTIGIDEPDLKKLETFVGPPLNIQFMKCYGVDRKTASYLVEQYRKRYAVKGIYECHMYEGIDQLLENCYALNKHMAVASSKPEVYVKQIIHEAGYDKYFDIIQGSNLNEETEKNRTDNKPEIVRKALEALTNGQKEQTVMVGDRAFDIHGAKANHVMSVGVTYGYGTKEELSKADRIVDSVNALELELVK